jgi:polyphosphate glucokinase
MAGAAIGAGVRPAGACLEPAVTARRRRQAGEGAVATPVILVVDVGGNNIKLYHSGSEERRKMPSGPELTPERLVADVGELARDWTYDHISIGCPGPVRDNRIVREPVNLGGGWLDFDLAAAFGKPTKLVNDAEMQALGSYEGGRMLFLGLGTGLGVALVADHVVIGSEIMHLPYKRGMSYEDYVGRRGLERMGTKKWRKAVGDVTALLKQGLVADYVVLGGGNVKLLKSLPPDCRPGDNANAFQGGVRLWQRNVRIV